MSREKETKLTQTKYKNKVMHIIIIIIIIPLTQIIVIIKK
jgi:hypothetical protein